MSIGFLTKVKKILECVCYSCSKLKIDDVSAITFLRGFLSRAPPPGQAQQITSFVFVSDLTKMKLSTFAPNRTTASLSALAASETPRSA